MSADEHPPRLVRVLHEVAAYDALHARRIDHHRALLQARSDRVHYGHDGGRRHRDEDYVRAFDAEVLPLVEDARLVPGTLRRLLERSPDQSFSYNRDLHKSRYYTKSDRLRTTPPHDYTICNTPIYTLHIA